MNETPLPAAPVKDSPASLVNRSRWLPGGLAAYHRADLGADLLAGGIVALLLVPQAMAYALLAGLPPQVGLYASILPPVIYGLTGSSRVLAVGPVALVSLLAAAGLHGLAEPGSPAYLRLALTLALLVGVMQALLGLARLGRLVSFISHPVLGGFTSAAALTIAFSQAGHLLGLSLPAAESFPELLAELLPRLGQLNPATLLFSAANIFILLLFRSRLEGVLRRAGFPAGLALSLAKSGPLVVVLGGAVVVWAVALHDRLGVAVVGEVPSGLPGLTLPGFEPNTWLQLAPTALAISLIGFLESVSIGRSLASRRRQKIDADRELLALGLANLGAAFTGGYPVTGGLSRSLVNFNAGARSGLASIVTAGFVIAATLLLTPLFQYLPRAALAAVIVVAVSGLVDLAALPHTWRYNKADALSWLAAFVVVLGWGVEAGILSGIALSLVLYLWRTSQPHVAVVGRVGESEHFRNVLRYQVQTWPDLLLVRVDESLYFANSQYLENSLLSQVAENPQLRHLVLICSAVNFIDASALETLENLLVELSAAGVELHLAEVKGPVMDRLQRSNFLTHLGAERLHLSAHLAVGALVGTNVPGSIAGS